MSRVEPVTGSPQTPVQTILVVDDNDAVRRLVVTILERANLRVLSARSGADAIELAETVGEIHLLLTDIEMPSIQGPNLGEILKQTRPDMRVMLMSAGDHGILVLNYGWAFIAKPFLPVRLVQMIGNVWHTPDRIATRLPIRYPQRRSITCGLCDRAGFNRHYNQTIAG